MTLAIVVGGAVLVAVLVSAVATSNPGGAVPAGRLVERADREEAPRPARIVEWEGLLLSGSTSGRRGRARLARHLEPVVAATLLDRHGLTPSDPRAEPILGWEWALLEGGPPPAGSGADADAVLAATERLLDRLDAARPEAAS